MPYKDVGRRNSRIKKLHRIESKPTEKAHTSFCKIQSPGCKVRCWGLLSVFRSLDGVNRPWGSPAYWAVRLGPRPLVHGGVNSVGGSFVLGRQTMRICVVRSANQLSTTRYSHSEPSKHIIRIQYFVTYVSEKNSPSKSTYLQHGDTHPVLKFSSIINLTAQCPSCGTNSYPVGVMLNVQLVSE